MKIRPSQRLFSPVTGREIRPEISSLQKLEVNNLLDAMRWVDRIGHHAWRIGAYCGEPRDPDSTEPAPAPPVPTQSNSGNS